MILPNYTTFRHYASTTKIIMADGYEQWPQANLAVWTTFATVGGLRFPLWIPIASAKSYTYYLSQRTDDPALQDMVIYEADTMILVGMTEVGRVKLGIADATQQLTTSQMRAIVQGSVIYGLGLPGDTIGVFNMETVLQVAQ